jgi:hypothetical protein
MPSGNLSERKPENTHKTLKIIGFIPTQQQRQWHFLCTTATVLQGSTRRSPKPRAGTGKKPCFPHHKTEMHMLETGARLTMPLRCRKRDNLAQMVQCSSRPNFSKQLRKEAA